MHKRSAGILLHISSLPSPYGIGDLGPSAHSFAYTLAAAQLVYWQFLPLTPTSDFIGNSPYSSPSAFAGNPLFISPDLLCKEGYLSYADLDCLLTAQTPEKTADNKADYSWAYKNRQILLNAAFERSQPRLETNNKFNAFCKKHAYWLDDYALFAAIKDQQGGSSWVEWAKPLKWREPKALLAWSAKHFREILRHKFIQFLFFSQLASLRMLCKRYGLKLIGDMPIYVTHDSADVWSAPEFFKLDADGHQLSVSGVPPDYFSATGQRWGNPVYNWERAAEDGFAWWKKRLSHNLLMADLVRLDHFRGFAGFWEIPAHEKTAVSGKWVPGPGERLFCALREEFGADLPIIAEDLGVITDDVRALMAKFSLPGMKVLHFAFGGSTPWKNSDAPFFHPVHSVVYTGTHDNNTSLGWFKSASKEEQENFCNYLGRKIEPEEVPEAMIRLALESSSEIAIIPMQDILELSDEARMNTPSVARGNWTWRLKDQCGWAEEWAPLNIENLDLGNVPLPQIFARLYDWCRVYGRVGHINKQNGDNDA